MNINVTPEDVDQMVKHALLEAGIGKAITLAIHKALTGCNSPVEAELSKYISEVTRELIREKFQAEVRSSLQASVEKNITKDVIDSAVNASMEKVVQALRESRY